MIHLVTTRCIVKATSTITSRLISRKTPKNDRGSAFKPEHCGFKPERWGFEITLLHAANFLLGGTAREVREQERETEEQWKNMMQISERTTYGRLMGSLWSEWTCSLCLLSWLKYIVYWILHSIHLYSHPAIRRANTKGSIAPQRNANVNLFVHFCHICAQCMFKHTHTSGLQARHQVC